MNVRNEVRRHGRTRLVALAAAGGVLAAGAGLLVPGAAQAAGAVDVVTYQYVGFWAQTWTVPAGVYSATFVLAGAQGGAGGDSSGGTGGAGGRGGELEAVLPVVPGQSYDLQVGDAGAPPGRFTAYGGWPGGGNGDQGGGGGGETTVGLTGGDPASPLLVAGGGGGGSEATTSTPGGPGFPGGAGGGLADATAGGGVTPGAGGSGGGPGTGDAGGAAGMGADATNSGTPGAQGTGGAGQGAAGAGGGGWYGGGSGGTNASPHTPAGAGGGGSGHAASLATDVVSHPGANYGDGWVQIRYTAPAPPVIYGTPPAGQVDQPYSFAFTSFGSPTPTFAVTGGSLPNGLTLSSDGRITGTPTWQGDYSFAVTATNGVDPADTENYTLTVTGVAPTISGTPPSGTVGAPYSFAYTLAGDPTPWAYVDTTGQPLPPGLSLSDDGHLTGTPTTAGTYTFTVVADNDYGNPATTQSTVTIAPAGPSTSAPTISGAPPWAGVGEPFAFVFRTTGTPTPTVTKSAGSLPPGLSLSSAGRLSGTPTTAGTYRFTVSAANGTGSPATDAVTMKVLPLPSVSIADASTAEGNSGTHPLTFRVTLSRTSSVPVTVHWATANGTATAGSDYVAGSGTVTFAPGTTSATVSVTVNGDRTKEATETFAVKLTSPSKAVIGDGSGTGTITNDD